MATWEPIDITHFDRDDIEDVYAEWDDDFKNDLEVRYNRIRKFDETSNESTDEDTIEMTERAKDAFKRGTIELVANQIYDKLTIYFNNARKRLGIQKGRPIEPIRNYDNFELADDGALTYVSKRKVIDLGNINDRLMSPWEMHRLGVNKLKSMGFMNIMDEDIDPYRKRYKRRREEKLKKLDKNLR